MPEFELEFATRQIRRAFERAIGRSIPKILTELITNADDSYRRLVDAGGRTSVKPAIEAPGPITILFERTRKRFSVVDHAEGLTDTEMEERFVTYGQESTDRVRGFRTRSLFGKGLRDVLFTQHHGQVKSIKDGKFYNCRFRWKDIKGREKPVVDIRPPTRATAELREALRIPGNGTLVEFELAEHVHNPQHDKLVEKLNRFYMLRMINSSPHREVVLRTIGHGEKVAEAQLNYCFPDGEVADRFEDDLNTEDGTNIGIKGEIALAHRELTQGEVGYEDREGGLLVLDEDDAVLDLWLFGFDEDPNARRLCGTLRLVGAGDYIRRKLNQKQPEEILTETREGFDKNHPFYRSLRDRIQPRLALIVQSLRDQGTQPKAPLSDRTRERHRQALDILNRIYREMMGKVARVPTIPASHRVPPPEGIAFAVSHVSVQTGVRTPVALLVNAALVGPEDTIELAADHPELKLSPLLIRIEQPSDSAVAQVKIVIVESDVPNIAGTVTASWKHTTASLDVLTTEREVITPVNGLEFDREEYTVRLGSRRGLRVFADVAKVPLGAAVLVTSDAPAVRIINPSLVVEPSNLVTAYVAQLDVALNGMELVRDVIVTASCGASLAGTKVSVVRRDREDGGRGGIFKDYRFAPLVRKVQSQFDPQGFILINTNDPVNARYFGVEPYRAVEQHAHCQVRLADLILNECLQMMVSEALESGKLDRRFPNNPEIDVRNYVDEKKFEIGPQIHNLLVTEA
jgi:hypothetical protein